MLQVGAVTVEMPGVYADVWLDAMSGANPVNAVIPGMLTPEGQEAIVTGLIYRKVTARDIERAVEDAFAAAGGRQWWEVVRLAGMSMGSVLFPALLLEGMRPDRVTLGSWIEAAYILLTRNRDEQERTKIDFDLKLPPGGVGAVDDMQGFDAIKW
jgi:hypothetical protein